MIQWLFPGKIRFLYHFSVETIKINSSLFSEDYDPAMTEYHHLLSEADIDMDSRLRSGSKLLDFFLKTVFDQSKAEKKYKPITTCYWIQRRQDGV